MVVKIFLLVISLSLFGVNAAGQLPQPLQLSKFPLLQQGIPIEPYALFYQQPDGQTTQPVTEVAKQQFVPAAFVAGTHFMHSRQMDKTSQVVWLQFRIANTHPSDTLSFWYGTGIHAYLTLYLKKKDSFIQLATGGMCMVPAYAPLGRYALPLKVPPLTNHHYFVRVTDHLLMFDNVPGTLHTTQSYQGHLLAEKDAGRWLFFVMSMIIGCIFLMCLYSFYQYYLSRDKAFLFYAIYAGLAFCWILKFASPRFELGLTPAAFPWLAHPWSFSFSHILSLPYALFLSNLLSIPEHQPKLWRFIRWLMLLLFLLQVMTVIQLFTGLLISSPALFFIIDAVPSLCMGVLLIIATLRSRSRLKPFLLVGALSLYVISLSPVHGIFLFDGASPQLAAIINYPPFFMALGLFIELFCFTLALAYRNKLVELEKNRLQVQYSARLESALFQRTNEITAQSRQLEEQHANQLRLAFEQQLAEMEMTALRAQMNPHFIFNCLNSIKLYTMDNDAARASVYLTKFSRLIRLVLENSRCEKVTLNRELDALQLYLELEAMRFKDKLRFSIKIDPAIDSHLIEIPPMLLQPYVENAIWHGLMHKKEGGNVEVVVVLVHTDCLQISITDDGIGRTSAAAIKSKTATANKSFGMKVTNERISIINQLYKSNTKVQVNDLVDAEGNAAGTGVILDIPI